MEIEAEEEKEKKKKKTEHKNTQRVMKVEAIWSLTNQDFRGLYKAGR